MRPSQSGPWAAKIIAHPCSMQFNSIEVSAPVASKQHRSAADRCASACTRQQDVTVGVKLILQNIPIKVVHFTIHTEFSSARSSKADFSTLRWFMTVFSYAKHALTLNQKRFRQIDNEQYNSHTDSCTVYVQILYHHHLNVT